MTVGHLLIKRYFIKPITWSLLLKIFTKAKEFAPKIWLLPAFKRKKTDLIVMSSRDLRLVHEIKFEVNPPFKENYHSYPISLPNKG